MKRALIIAAIVFAGGFSWQNPITLIVPFGVGGPTDLIARHVEIAIEKHSDVSVGVVNQAGAAGNIGMRSFVGKDKALLLATESIVTNKINMPYSYPPDITRQAVPIHLFGLSPYIIFAHKQHKTMFDLIEKSKTRDILIGSGANGTGSYHSFDLLCNVHKVLERCRLVVYQSASYAVADLMSGRLDVYVSLYSSYEQFTGSNDASAVALLSNKRMSMLENVPTALELGFDIQNYNWHGLFYKGLTSDITDKIAKAINLYFDDKRLEQLGIQRLEVSTEEFWNKAIND